MADLTLSDDFPPYTQLMLSVALLLLPGARMFDVAIITETWSPERLSSPPLDIELRRCSDGMSLVPLTEGAQCAPDASLAWAEAADVVLVPGLGDSNVIPEAKYLDVIREAHRRGAVVASLCSGAFVLAETGLLDGEAATTHWGLASALATRYPDVNVEPSVLFVGNNRVWTSAGVAAGIDLCIHLIRMLCGGQVATTVSRSMVMAPHRTGGQAQFVRSPVALRAPDGDALEVVRSLVAADPRQTRTVAEFARMACMSERTFVRRFSAETGTTPHQWVMNWRIDEASHLLEESEASIAEIASAVGYASPVSFRQRFKAVKGIAPLDYRKAFHPRS
ncbi:GlxA family transcriptional regulator [Paeniglutamicibacter sp. Y32M11]|uniref:GlxA family transcriptional regulator n=1 Tax=Paeniglutamicibacter sp. Y32M11 TaxID=2853258 RepID=UPI001C52E7A3|nr:helix-turn-helix domain-containing protein [Paeniglutamicibacter sp. Y32M11]QXQ11985.1 helix-turn-helix domain-containing protein [Paeniglutamicibacter sp. Y32M11]